MQDGAKEIRCFPPGDNERHAQAEDETERFEHGHSLADLRTIVDAGPVGLEERSSDALVISYGEELGHSFSNGKRGSRGGRGRGRGRGRGSRCRSGDGDTDETNSSFGNARGKGRGGRGRGRALIVGETHNSPGNGDRGRRGRGRGRTRGRGRGGDAAKPGRDVEPQSFGEEQGAEEAVAAQHIDALCDERDCPVNGSAPVTGAHNDGSRARMPVMRGQVVQRRGRGTGELAGKSVRATDGTFGAEEVREVGSSAAEENRPDPCGDLLEVIPTSSPYDQVRVIESQSTGLKTTEIKDAELSINREVQEREERVFSTLEDGNGYREPTFSPDLEEIIRMWLSEIEILPDWPLYAQLSAASPELRMKFDGSNTSRQEFEAIKLPLFKSAAITSSEAAPEDNPRSCKDILLNAGGPVWALDWCPRRPGWAHTGADKKEFLAVGTHPVSSPYNRMGACLNGKGLIQIWALDLKDFISEEEENQYAERGPKGRNSASVGLSKKGRGRATSKVGDRVSGRGKGKGKAQETVAALGLDFTSRADEADEVEPFVLKWHEDWHEPSAQMVLGLSHEGLVTWDAKWQPVGESENTVRDRETFRLGYLAVVLGDGSLQVFDVPLPTIFTNTTMSSSVEPLIVNIQPVFKCSSLGKRGFKSIPVSLEWSTWDPHDRLLVGFHDASVGVWKFVPKLSATDTRPLMLFQADSLPLRSVAWAPDGSGPQGRHLIVTAGHSGWVKFWDLRLRLPEHKKSEVTRDIFRPIWDLQTSRCCISSVDWLSFPRCVLMSMDDGTLRLLGVQNASSTTPATGQPWRGTHAQGLQCYLCSSFAIWSVQVSRGTGLVAYAGVSGTVLQFQLTEKAVLKEGARAREPHYLCGGFGASSENGPLTLISAKTSEPAQMKKSSTEWGSTPTSKRNFLASCTLDPDSVSPTDSQQVALTSEETSVPRPKRAKGIAATGTICQVNRHRDAQKNSLRRSSGSKELVLVNASVSEGTGEQRVGQSSAPSSSSGPLVGERFPCRNIAVHRVKWNCNHLKRQWLAYGGAAGCQRLNMFPAAKHHGFGDKYNEGCAIYVTEHRNGDFAVASSKVLDGVDFLGIRCLNQTGQDVEFLDDDGDRMTTSTLSAFPVTPSEWNVVFPKYGSGSRVIKGSRSDMLDSYIR